MPPIVLGEFEQVVLLALLRLGADAYGASVVQAINDHGGRDVSISAVHTTLDRLEQKGLLRSRVGDPTPQRGGKRKRHYEPTPAGLTALRASYRTWRGLVDGLEDVLTPAGHWKP
jgi:PadR family transcriptional regulator, regulatory protein PadR